MNIALIGSGFIASEHIKSLKELGQNVQVVVDINEDIAKSFANTWAIPKYYTNPRDAIASDIDCVHICTPPVFHFDVAKAAMLAGKHVVCEKPICIDINEAKELVKVAKDTGVVNAIDFNVRFHDSCQALKDKVSEKDFGKILMIYGCYMQEFHSLPVEYTWRYNTEFSGKTRATSEIGSHWIDLARFLSGLEITSVSATYGAFIPERALKDGVMYPVEDMPNEKKVTVSTDDSVCAVLRFSNGALGNILLSEISFGRCNSLKIEVLSDKKSVWWDSESPYDINSATKFSGVTKSTNAFRCGFPTTFKNFFAKVYKDIENGTKRCDYPTFNDGYINASVCKAIYDSANNNSVWTEVKYEI